jgi:hypothetical protein
MRKEATSGGYDLIEKLPEGKILWRASAPSYESALARLKSLAAETKNAVMICDSRTHDILARLNDGGHRT